MIQTQTQTISYSYDQTGRLLTVSIASPPSFPLINKYFLERLVKNIGTLKYDEKTEIFHILLDYERFEEAQNLVSSRLKAHLYNAFRFRNKQHSLSPEMRIDSFMEACLHPSKAESTLTANRWSELIQRVRKSYLFNKTIWVPMLIELYIEMARLPADKITPIVK